MTYLHNIRVQWARKSNINGKFPFDVIKPKKWETESTSVLKEIPLVRVDRETFNKISNTLEDLPADILELAENSLIAIKCEEDFLAIDTQGYKYPRYKSYIVFQENY